ncbi:hypothetical protein [Priestia koreensis]|uniref:hypothetical protein n=1 Tax=Priestia koreensis TaxID=284581 RepID=UPI003459CD78
MSKQSSHCHIAGKFLVIEEGRDCMMKDQLLRLNFPYYPFRSDIQGGFGYI